MKHVRQRLLTRRPQHEADVRPRGVEELRDRVAHRPIVAAAVQAAKQMQRVGHRLPLRRHGLWHSERMQRSMMVAILEQRLVVDREERAAQRREHRQLVVGPLDGRERAADRLHLLAFVKRLAADEQVRDTARFERVHVRTRHVLAEVKEPAKQDGHVPRLDGHRHRQRVARRAFGDGPPALVHQPVHERAHGIRQRFLDGVAGDAAKTIRLGHRQRDDRRLLGLIGSRRRRQERHVFGLQRVAIAGHQRRKRGVHRALD